MDDYGYDSSAECSDDELVSKKKQKHPLSNYRFRIAANHFNIQRTPKIVLEIPNNGNLKKGETQDKSANRENLANALDMLDNMSEVKLNKTVTISRCSKNTSKKGNGAAGSKNHKPQVTLVPSSASSIADAIKTVSLGETVSKHVKYSYKPSTPNGFVFNGMNTNPNTRFISRKNPIIEVPSTKSPFVFGVKSNLSQETDKNTYNPLPAVTLSHCPEQIKKASPYSSSKNVSSRRGIENKFIKPDTKPESITFTHKPTSHCTGSNKELPFVEAQTKQVNFENKICKSSGYVFNNSGESNNFNFNLKETPRLEVQISQAPAPSFKFESNSPKEAATDNIDLSHLNPPSSSRSQTHNSSKAEASCTFDTVIKNNHTVMSPSTGAIRKQFKAEALAKQVQNKKDENPSVGLIVNNSKNSDSYVSFGKNCIGTSPRSVFKFGASQAQGTSSDNSSASPKLMSACLQNQPTNGLFTISNKSCYQPKKYSPTIVKNHNFVINLKSSNTQKFYSEPASTAALESPVKKASEKVLGEEDNFLAKLKKQWLDKKPLDENGKAIDNIENGFIKLSLGDKSWLKNPSQMEQLSGGKNVNTSELQEMGSEMKPNIRFFSFSSSTKKSVQSQTQTDNGLTNLWEILECPVCYEIPLSHIRACPSGHILCADCKLVVCPLCHQPMVTSRYTVLEQVIQVIPLPCRYRTEGCKVELSIGNKLDHEMECRYNFQCQKE